jgi:branched-chain amino acid transport system substrate-binding protein
MEAEVLLLIANSVDTAQLVQQIRKLDADVLLVAAEWAASERLIALGGRTIEGLELVQSYNRTDQSERYTAFHETYRSQFQQVPGYASVAAYDAATVLFKALAQRDAAGGLKEALLSLGEVQGLQQTITFNRYGDAQRRAFFVVVRDGQFALQ